jgi:hypothetical protein
MSAVTSRQATLSKLDRELILETNKALIATEAVRAFFIKKLAVILGQQKEE